MACPSSAFEIESPAPPPDYPRAANDFEASTSFSSAASSAFEIEIEIESPAPPPGYPRAANDFEASTSAYTAASSAFEIEIVSESRAPPTDYPRAANDFEASTSAYPAANDFEASTSASTAVDTNENSSISYGHDVFISHRGPDVKKTFASHLYHRLLVHHVRAFLDKPEMQVGENISAQIKDAIATAAVHVAILSPGFADSRWCLDELVDMLESKAEIIPVFYNVTPADLRWTQGKDGVYADALRNLEKKTTYDSETQEEKPRYSSNTIENWRKALATVSEISGFELAAFDGDEGVLLEKLVELLLKKVKKKEKELYVADYPTGLEEKVKHFESFLSKLPENRPKVAAIVGLGGIGKTTVAKELFNRKRPYYRRSCFLSAVRDTAKSGGGSLVGLQKKLLRSLFGNDYQIDSIDIGKQQLMSCFRSFSHGMLILDDVDHLDQLDALLPGADKYTFPSNCLVLITSRDKCVLARSGIQPESIYQLTGLNTHHSRELFCRYAFCQPHPLPCFQYFVDSILKICAGLPLSLKVIGSHFCGNTEETYWEAELSRLKYGHPDIQQILKISFDSLDEEEKQLFLYISCFIIREKMDTAMKVWNQSGCKGFSVFQNLQNKSLVEVDGGFIHMHDHLRELGRRIAENSGFCIPCLWDRTENSSTGSLFRMLEQPANHNVCGISMVPSANQEPKYYAPFRSDMTWFKRTTHELLGNPVMKLCNRLHKTVTMDNLQLLITEDQLLESILRTVALPNLRWLRWYKCGHSSLPSWIPKENLRVLYVAGKALKILWQCKAQAPLQLRELKILAPLSKLPKSIGQLKHLEEIYIWLHEQNNMRSLPHEFCQLPSLKRFELINAWKMESLPDSFGNLVTLEHLNLSCSRSLKRLPTSFEKLIRLKYLDLRGSDMLIISTTTNKNIARSRERHVQQWYKMEKEEEDGLEERVWRDKWIDRQTKKEVWVEIGGSLEIDEWVEFEEPVELEERVWSDKWMDQQWRMGRRLRSFAYVLDVIFVLEIISLVFYVVFSMVSAAKWMSWVVLTVWVLSFCLIICGETLRRKRHERRWEAWRAEREWAERKWAVRECPRMRETSDTASLTHFRQALLAEEMNQLMPLQLPPSLQELHIKELPSTFENLCNLEVLELDGSFSKMLPPSLSVLSNLKELRLVNCPRLKCLPDSLGLLSVLEVKCCPGLVDVRTLPTTLIQLSLISCPKLKKIDLGPFGLAELQTLNLSGWTEVEELAGIETLVSLEELRASGCENLKRIRGLWQLTKLKQLDVHGCSKIEELEGVEHLRLLEKLDASDCPHLKIKAEEHSFCGDNS